MAHFHPHSFQMSLNTKIAVMAYLGAVKMIIQPDILMENQFSIEDAFNNILTIFLEGIQK